MDISVEEETEYDKVVKFTWCPKITLYVEITHCESNPCSNDCETECLEKYSKLDVNKRFVGVL